MLEIKLVSYDDLSEEEKEWQPENGSGAEYANYLQIIHNGVIIGVESDAMEPEDAIFSRDLDWIRKLVLKAYTLGIREGLK